MQSVLFIVAIVAAAVAVPILISRADAFRPIVVEAASVPVLQRAGAATRWRAALTLGSAASALIAGAAWNAAAPEAFGLPLMLAPGLAASLGLLVFAAVPPARLDGQTRRRVASLSPRYPWSHGPRWAYLLPLGTAVAVVVFAILAGLASTPSDDGHYRSIGFASGDYTTSAGPYPGWFYGVPLIAMTIVLFASTLLALWRISAAPAPSVEALRAPDDALRTLSARVVMKLSSGALLTYAGGVLFFAGMATRNAAGNLPGDGAVLVAVALGLGVAETIVGVLAALGGISLLALAATDACRPLLARGGVSPVPSGRQQ